MWVQKLIGKEAIQDIYLPVLAIGIAIEGNKC